LILARANGRPVRSSTDGRSVYLEGVESDPASGAEVLAIYRLDMASRTQELWKRLAPPDMAGFIRYGSRIKGSGFAITPDGRYYAYTYFTDQSQLVLAEGRPDWWK
jgi:hypothetical protein